MSSSKFCCQYIYGHSLLIKCNLSWILSFLLEWNAPSCRLLLLQSSSPSFIRLSNWCLQLWFIIYREKNLRLFEAELHACSLEGSVFPPTLSISLASNFTLNTYFTLIGVTCMLSGFLFFLSGWKRKPLKTRYTKQCKINVINECKE